MRRNEMDNLTKIILKYYIRRNRTRYAIQQAFLKHWSIVPVKGSIRFSRKVIFESIEESLRLSPNNYHRHYMQACLRQLGVVLIDARGYRFFKGIKKI
jgi:hypothetical protein